MFLLGVFVGLIVPPLYSVINTVYKADIALRNMVNTSLASNLKFMCRCAALRVEQALVQSLRYDSEKKKYVVSFYIKGALHQLYVKPKMGPGKTLDDPVARGYAALDLGPLEKANQ